MLNRRSEGDARAAANPIKRTFSRPKPLASSCPICHAVCLRDGGNCHADKDSGGWTVKKICGGSPGGASESRTSSALQRKGGVTSPTSPRPEQEWHGSCGGAGSVVDILFFFFTWKKAEGPVAPCLAQRSCRLRRRAFGLPESEVVRVGGAADARLPLQRPRHFRWACDERGSPCTKTTARGCIIV